MKFLLTFFIILSSIGIKTNPAEAPSPIVMAWRNQIDLGYTPCKPIVSPLPQNQKNRGIIADSNNGEQFGFCEIRIASNLHNDDLDWVAWHEVCHLSTIQDIFNSKAVEYLKDPVHDHPLFKDCIKQGPNKTGGY